MQNGTVWRSAQIWGFSAQLPWLEKLITYSCWNWGPSVSGTCPVAPYLIVLWIYAEWHWVKICTNLGIPRTVAWAGEASNLFALNSRSFRFGHLPCCPLLNSIMDLCRMGLGENQQWFGDSPHSCLGCRRQVIIRFTFETLPFRALACCPLLNFIMELCIMALDEDPHKFGDSPHSCLGWRNLLLIRFEFEFLPFRALALLTPT